MARNSSNISSTSTGMMPSEGSSSRISIGLAIMARAIASICCSPPDIVVASWSRRSASRGKISAISSISSRLAAAFSRRRRPGRAAGSPAPSGRARCAAPPARRPGRARSGCAPARSAAPARRSITAPLRLSIRPMIGFSVVVLPAPLRPISVTISPWRPSKRRPAARGCGRTRRSDADLQASLSAHRWPR